MSVRFDRTTVGFTGTRAGLTTSQFHQLRKRLQELLDHATFDHQQLWLVHGSCVGADGEAHLLAKALGISTRIRPSNIVAQRALCEADEAFSPEPPLARNKKVVGDCDLLLACPKQAKEVLRSGTWATIRYAQGLGKPVEIFEPEPGERRLP